MVTNCVDPLPEARTQVFRHKGPAPRPALSLKDQRTLEAPTRFRLSFSCSDPAETGRAFDPNLLQKQVAINPRSHLKTGDPSRRAIYMYQLPWSGVTSRTYREHGNVPSVRGVESRPTHSLTHSLITHSLKLTHVRAVVYRSRVCVTEVKTGPREHSIQRRSCKRISPGGRVYTGNRPATRAPLRR